MNKEQIQTVLDALHDIDTMSGADDDKLHLAIAILEAALAEPSEPIEPNNDEVICQKCAHQFRAIPVSVQKLLLDAGIEPPFTHPESKPATLPELTDDDARRIWLTVLSETQGPLPIEEFARAILAAAREKAK